MAGTVQGTVTDGDGVAFEYARVTIADSATGDGVTVFTDENGAYSAVIVASTYDVRAEKAGFADDEEETVPVGDGETKTVNLALSALSPKVVGENTSGPEIGVLGRVTDGQGSPIGVQGEVKAEDGYGLYTPDDARIDGTVETADEWRVETQSQYGDAGNVVQGHPDNDVADDAVGSTVGGGGGNVVNDDHGTVAGGTNNTTSGTYATVGGGGHNDAEEYAATVAGGASNEAWQSYAAIGGGHLNRVYDRYGTVAGGYSNWAGSDDSDATNAEYATVGGGYRNEAEGLYSTVAGGQSNDARDENASIGGGYGNVAQGADSRVGGGYANYANDEGSTVGGGAANSAQGAYATIAGGGPSDPEDTTTRNVIYDDYGTIGGGGGNVAGYNNSSVIATFATVGGGKDNHARDTFATIPGGENNTAGEHAFAAGRNADANYPGSFVWADSHDSTFSASGYDTWNARCRGGARFVTSLDNNDDPDAGVTLNGGGGSWSSLSASASKTNVRPVDPEAVLDGVTNLSINTWEYRTEEGVDHMGPMAEDFADAFGLGPDEEHITNVDADGVALAAVQGLAERLEETAERVDERDERTDALEAETGALREENERLRERNEALERRLAAVENHLDGVAERGVADD